MTLGNLGSIAFIENDLRTALMFYRRSITANPGEVAAYVNLGLVLEKLGRLSEAEAEFARAVSLAPNYPAARANLERVRENQAR